MPPIPALELPSIFIISLIGLLAGGLVTYIANWLLYTEGLLQSGPSKVKWEYLLVEIVSAFMFLLIAWRFGLTAYSFGMMLFVSILLAICITDFKAKIIPHEITYPAIIVGIIFSIMVRADLLGTLAGIGISYILFDFLAFYGLKFYLFFNKPTLAPSQHFISSELSAPVNPGKKATNILPWLSKDLQPATLHSSSKKNNLSARLYCKGIPVEELEIIGGGDAVLSALISAWLGWQKLAVALIAGFIIGTFLGAVYVLIELWKERLIKTIIVPVTACVISLCLFVVLISLMVAKSAGMPLSDMPYLQVLPWIALAGCTIGIIIAGTKVSKPFPFGPALAAGALIAIFRHS